MVCIKEFLCNGFNVVYVNVPGYKTNTVSFLVNVGSVDDPLDKKGIAHALEHMLFSGSDEKDTFEFNREISRLGEPNAYTSFDRTVYSISSTKENFQNGFQSLCDMMFRSLIDSDIHNKCEKAFEKEKRIIIEEIPLMESAERSFSVNLMRNLWGETASWVTGTEESVNSITVQDLRDFKNKYYTKSNMVLFIIGDYEEVFVKTVCYGMLKDLNIPYGEFNIFKKIDPNFEEFVDTYEASEQSAICLSFYGNTDYTLQGRLLQMFFLRCLCNGMDSILFQKLRNELGLCYFVDGASSGYGTNKTIDIITFLSKDNIHIALQEIQNELQKIKENGFDDDLIDSVKSSITYFKKKESNDLNIYSDLFQELYSFHIKEISLLDALDIDKFISIMQSIDNNQLIEFAKKMVDNAPKISILNNC